MNTSAGLYRLAQVNSTPGRGVEPKTYGLTVRRSPDRTTTGITILDSPNGLWVRTSNLRINSPLGFLQLKLSTKSCGLSKLSTHKWSRHIGLSTHKWSRIYAYLVAPLIKSLYLPVINAPVVGASPYGDKSATCHPNGLHLPPTAF